MICAQHAAHNKKSKRRDYNDIPGAGPYKDAGSACMVACGEHLRSLGMGK